MKFHPRHTQGGVLTHTARPWTASDERRGFNCRAVSEDYPTVAVCQARLGRFPPTLQLLAANLEGKTLTFFNFMTQRAHRWRSLDANLRQIVLKLAFRLLEVLGSDIACANSVFEFLFPELFEARAHRVESDL